MLSAKNIGFLITGTNIVKNSVKFLSIKSIAILSFFQICLNRFFSLGAVHSANEQVTRLDASELGRRDAPLEARLCGVALHRRPGGRNETGFANQVSML